MMNLCSTSPLSLSPVKSSNSCLHKGSITTRPSSKNNRFSNLLPTGSAFSISSPNSAVFRVNTSFRNKRRVVMSDQTAESASEAKHSARVVVEFPSSQHLFSHPKSKTKSNFLKFEDLDTLSTALANEVIRISNEAIKAKGCFTIVLSGGSLVKALVGLSKNTSSSVDWSKWYVFWADERVVPLSHPDSNYKFAKDVFLSLVPIPESHVYAINDQLSAEEAAIDYENRIKELTDKGMIPTTSENVFPRFDLILLGVGPDGHIASLFPNSILLSQKEKWVISINNSPKPPPKRITLSLPTINSAVNIAFVVFGSGKAEVLQRILERPALPGSLPAQMVRPYSGTVTWYTDVGAASQLSPETWNSPNAYPFLDFKS